MSVYSFFAIGFRQPASLFFSFIFIYLFIFHYFFLMVTLESRCLQGSFSSPHLYILVRGLLVDMQVPNPGEEKKNRTSSRFHYFAFLLSLFYEHN